MNPYELLIQRLPEIEQKLGYSFIDKSLLISAFVHSSFLNEYKDHKLKHNERLEFLGDSVLNLIIAEYLFKNFPALPEGELSALRSSIVSAPSCVDFLLHLGVERYILLGRGEQLTTGRGKVSILADLFEAILGALYLDSTMKQAEEFFLNRFLPLLESKIKKPRTNAKAKLQELVQKIQKQIPVYKVMEESGPDHEKLFVVGVYINEQLIGQGVGNSKKDAEQQAAEAALEKLQGTLL